MRLIHVKLEKIRNKLFVKIPELIAEALHLKEGEGIEISIHSEPAFAQGDLWGDEPEEVEEIDDIKMVERYCKSYNLSDNSVECLFVNKAKELELL